ncbi:hypothetical protein [Enterocloster lavalensis]|nr:hypothetical protein [Enterocloster lavalensis]
MKIFSTYYDRAPSLEENAYTFVRVSHGEPPKHCHRHLIGDFLNIDVQEI